MVSAELTWKPHYIDMQYVDIYIYTYICIYISGVQQGRIFAKILTDKGLFEKYKKPL